jgi:predicted nucleic acid-binding Zn ribbon protein
MPEDDRAHGDDTAHTGDRADDSPEQPGNKAALEALGRMRAQGSPVPKAKRRTEEWSSSRDPNSLGEVVDEYLTRQGWDHDASVAGVVVQWEEIVGPQIAAHCQVESFADGALILRASSSAWATQIRLLMPQLQARIDKVVGAGTVNAITVRGPVGPSWKKGLWSVRGRGPRDTYG